LCRSTRRRRSSYITAPPPSGGDRYSPLDGCDQQGFAIGLAIMISILIADDHALVRKALQQLLEIEGDIQVIAVASDGLEAVEQAILHSPDVAVMDVSMPFLNGIEATRQICARRPGTRVLILSMHETAHYVQRGMEAGASGYVLKDIACDDLVMAVRSLHQGNRFFSRQFAAVARQYSE